MPIEIETLNDARAFVRHAQPGERGLYHEGELASDTKGSHRNPLKEALAAKVKYLRTQSTNGLVMLFQSRVGVSHYRYLAVRTAKPAG